MKFISFALFGSGNRTNFIDELEEERSKPRRKNDSELDYLSTRYLSELIKSMGFDGIGFRSS